MNENDSINNDGFFRGIVRDDGVQRAVAGVAVAVVVAGVKRAVFGTAA